MEFCIKPLASIHAHQNCRVQRKHRHILNLARVLRFQANLQIGFWDECASTVAYMINRTPTPLLGNKSPYDILFGKSPIIQLYTCILVLCYANN